MIVTVLVALAVIYSRPLANVLERLSGEKRSDFELAFVSASGLEFEIIGPAAGGENLLNVSGRWGLPTAMEARVLQAETKEQAVSKAGSMFERKRDHGAYKRGGRTHAETRALGPGSLIALGIGAIIGAGMFVAHRHRRGREAGPAVVLSMVSPPSAAPSRAVLHRIRQHDPGRGQRLHLRLRHAGRTVAWIIGWDLVLE